MTRDQYVPSVNKGPLTPKQVSIIKSTIPILKEHGNTITSTFYATVIKENPELNNIFNHANQVNNHQAGALAGALFAYASFIDDLGVLSPAVEKICQKHASLYIRPEHYVVVGTYLLRAMGDVLGDAFTPDIFKAWEVAYWQLANIMIKREEDIYSEAEGWTDWRDFRIAKKVPESSEITSFYLEPVSGERLPSFKPGQYISLMTRVPQFKYMQSRQYSLSAAPSSSYYRISVKAERDAPTANGNEKDADFHPGWISNILHQDKKEGDIVQLSHPAGEFFCDIDSTKGPIVLMSAGVGLTPMVSILDTLIEKKLTSRGISWVHATRSSEVQAFADHIKTVVKEYEGVTAAVFNKSPREDAVEGVDYKSKSRMNVDVLEEKYLYLQNADSNYYICGPDAFMANMSRQLEQKGVGKDRIHMEVFGTGDRINSSE